MQNLHNLFLVSGVLVSLLTACQKPEQDPFAHSPSESLDPTRHQEPYPVIALPEGADLESSTWKGIDLSPKPPLMPVSALEQQGSFVLKPGYQITPVLSEPQIREPAAIQFDGNGRMYVLELRSYMQDLNATGELLPTSRISRWEDLDDDGVYETGIVFLDSLVFPRFIVPFGPNSILSMESNEDHVYRFTDTNGDGKADKKELFASGLGRSGNVEHQTSFLTWTLDNWMYSTYNNKRIRWTPNGVIQEASGNPWGQWGVTQDNYGKIWFQDGAGGVPQGFQFPIVYGNFSVKGALREGFRTPYSLIQLADFQPGMKEAKSDGSLANVTGAAGNDVFRGDRLPQDLVGKYIYGEPVGRIVRSVTTENEEGLTFLQNSYIEEKSEFIQSRDPLFRPVDIATAPDGTLYIVDMYRGIIQEGNWTQEGSYLRTKIQQYQMDDIIGNGRIWRLSYEGMPRNTEKPRMYEETSAELIRHLSHPNGWWRDMAQQILIFNQDKSVVPALRQLATESENHLARIHALWTLEGLGELSPELLSTFVKDPSPILRTQGLRAGESLYTYGQKNIARHFREATQDAEPNVAIQGLLSASRMQVDGLESLIRETMNTQQSQGVQLVGGQLLEKIAEEKKAKSHTYSPENLALFEQGKSIYTSYCATCHGPKGLGSPAGDGQLLAPPFSGSPRILGHPEYATKVMLHGLSGTIENKEYEGLMISMKDNDDAYIASVISYIRNDFGNKGSFVQAEYIRKIRKQTESRTEPYGFDELIGEIPKALHLHDNWIVQASSTALQGVGSTRDPAYAFTFKGWQTETAQQPAMWFQVTFPEAKSLTEIQFESGRETFPIHYAIKVSTDGQTWKQVATAKGQPELNTCSWETTDTFTHLKIESLDQGSQPWAMRNLKIYAR